MSVEQVDNYKYLGMIIDNKLTWNEHAVKLLKKINTRMYCLRKIRSFNVSKQLLQMFYTSTVCSVLTFGAVCWGGNVTKQDKDRFEKLIRKAGGVVGKKQDTFSDMYDRKLRDRLKTILTDETHPLHVDIDSRRSDISDRFRAPRVRTTRYSNSFVPAAIRLHNLKLKPHSQ